MNTDKTPQEETDASMMALVFAIVALSAFLLGLGTMWLFTRIWS